MLDPCLASFVDREEQVGPCFALLVNLRSPASELRPAEQPGHVTDDLPLFALLQSNVLCMAPHIPQGMKRRKWSLEVRGGQGGSMGLLGTPGEPQGCDLGHPKGGLRWQMAGEGRQQGLGGCCSQGNCCLSLPSALLKSPPHVPTLRRTMN